MAKKSTIQPFQIHWSDYWPKLSQTPIVARCWTLQKDFQPHSHDFMEIVMIVAGKGTHRAGRGDQQFHRGDVFVLRPGSWHAYLNITEKLIAYNLTFSADLLRRELSWAMDDPFLRRLLWAGPLATTAAGVECYRVPESAIKRCVTVFDQLHHLGEKDRSEQRAQRIGLMFQALGILASGLPDEGQPSQRMHPAVHEIMQLMEKNLAHDWSLEELAGHLRMDESYLVRIFSAAIGVPPISYLLRCRAERAAKLLAESSAPITEIGVAVGWNDPAYFARRFRAHFGLSASEYRRRFLPSAHNLLE